MINVIASIRVKAGKLPEFLEILNANVPNVIKENGCIQYVPTIDIDANLLPQVLDENVVTLIEKWKNMESLQVHLKSPHMLAYREKTRNIVEKLSIKVLKSC